MLDILIETVVEIAMRPERLDIDMQPGRYGREFVSCIDLPSIRLPGKLLGYECLEPVSAVQQNLQHAGIFDQTLYDGRILSTRHLETDTGCALRVFPYTLQKRKRLPVSRFHATEIQRAVTIFQRVKDAIRIEELVMAQHFWVRIEQRTQQIAPRSRRCKYDEPCACRHGVLILPVASL